MKRQYMGCAGRVANGINTVHLSYVREKTGHALIGARQWIPARAHRGPGEVPGHGPAAGPAVPHQGPAGHRRAARTRYADGLAFDFVCGDEVYGACTGAAGVPGGPRAGLRAAGRLELHPHARPGDDDDLRGGGEDAAEGQAALGGPLRRARARRASAGTPGPGSAPPPRGTSLLVRRHLKTGELAFHYCYVPEGQPAAKARLIRAAGLRWPVEESFELGKDCFGLDQCQARLYTAILRHLVLVMAALAICAVTAAQLRDRTDTQAPPPAAPGPAAARRPRPDPADRPARSSGCSPPLSARPHPPGHAARWLALATPPPGTITLVPPARTPGSATTPWSASDLRLPYY